MRHDVGILKGEEKEEKGCSALLAVDDEIKVVVIGKRCKLIVAQDVLVYILTQLDVADLGKIDAPQQIGQIFSFLNGKYHVVPEVLDMLFLP